MGTKILDQDTFTRANASGWGTASSGSTWATSTGSPTLSTASNEGHATGITAMAAMALGSVTSANAEGLVRVKTNNTSSTRMGVMLRQTASNTFYHSRLSSNANNMTISKVVSGTNTDLFTAAFTVTAGSSYWIRFKIVGTNLYGRAWPDGSSEPTTWTVSGTDSSIAGAGGFGLTINASSSATTWDFDSFVVTDATVKYDVSFRGVISATKAHDVSFRAPVSRLVTKDLLFRGNTGHPAQKDVTFRGMLSALIGKNTAFRGNISRIAGKNTAFRGNIGHTALKDLLFRGVLSKATTKNTVFRAPVARLTQKDVTFRGNIVSPPIASGGFALFANGTGTASFDHFRVTQYPDPALSLANVTPRMGNSIVSWDDTLPTNTTLAIKTSLDGVVWTDVTAQNGGSIPGLAGQPDPISDTFNSNTLANYTNTNKSGGSVATPTYDTGNSRISLSGGSGGLYLYTAITDNDVDLQAIMDESDAGGLVWRYVDSNNYYELGAYDDSASGGFTNALRLYKVVAGTRSLIGSASTISWPRATTGTSPYKIVRVTMLGSTITVYFDGIVMQTATDTTFTSGKMGLRNDGGTSRYYLFRMQQIGDYVTGTPSGDVVTGDFVYTQVTMSTTDPTVTPQLQDLTTSARSPQIATGALIPQLHDPSKPFAEYFNVEMDTLAKASGDYWWNVVNGGLIFAARQATLAPWCLHSADLLFAPTVQPTNSADLYRNRQNITNCTDLVTISNEEKIADGTATSWQLAYPLYSAPTIVVQGVTKTVGVQGVDTGKDFYWQAGSNGISQDVSAAQIPSGYILQFSYVGQFVRTVTADNVPEQAARALVEGGTGIVEAWEDGKGMLASNATTYANGLLARFGNNDTIELIAVTQRSGLASGQLLPVFIAEHSILDQYLLIVKLTTTGQQQLDGSMLYEYRINATNGPNLQNWTSALF